MSSVRERMRPMLAIVRRDLRQIRRHGLPVLALWTLLMFLLGIFIFTNTTSTFRETGVPSWTGLGGTPSEPLRANAQADVMAGLAPLTVKFTANLTGGTEPYNISWNFGDGNLSTEVSPTHVYASPGIYDVLLAVRENLGDEPVRSNIRIIAYGPGDWPLQAGISANRTAGKGPLSVTFHAAVVGGNPPYTYFWVFGDGQNSTDPAPSHTYGPREDSYRARLTVRDEDGNESASNELFVNAEPPGGVESLPFNLLDVVYGYMVLATMILIPVAFGTNYNSEMKKGTVRALTLYPVGVFEVTAAKLLYAAIAGLLLSFPISVLPSLSLGKPVGDVLGIYAAAYFLSLATVAAAAFTANAIALATKKMYIKPTLMAYLFVLLSFFFTSRIFGLTMAVLAGGQAAGIVRAAGPFITLSPYHQGGLLLSQALGGQGSPDWVAFLVPLALLVVGVWSSKKLWPDIYEKE